MKTCYRDFQIYLVFLEVNYFNFEKILNTNCFFFYPNRVFLSEKKQKIKEIEIDFYSFDAFCVR